MPELNQTTTQANPVSMFSTYTEHPSGVSFNQKEDQETIILLIRRHIITNIPWIVGTMILSVAPILILYLLQITNSLSIQIPTKLMFVILAFYYIIVLGYAFANFVSWFYNIGLVTDKRIFDIDFTNLSSINVAATALDDIQDVNYTQAGFAEQFFNYGDIDVQIDVNTQNYKFEKSPKPAQVVNIISKLIGGGRK